MNDSALDVERQRERQQVLAMRVIHACGESTPDFIGMDGAALYTELKHKGYIEVLDQAGSLTNRAYPHSRLLLTRFGIKKLEKEGCRTFGREKGNQNVGDLDFAEWLEKKFYATV